MSTSSESWSLPGSPRTAALAAVGAVAVFVAAWTVLHLGFYRHSQIIDTPVYKDVIRPWEIGIIHDQDERLSAPLIAALQATKRFDVGINQPYSPADRVYFTLERHARSRGLPCVMIEISNAEIADADGQARWAELLAQILGNIRLPASAGHPDPHLDS